jgi:hypothetical protein
MTMASIFGRSLSLLGLLPLLVAGSVQAQSTGLRFYLCGRGPLLDVVRPALPYTEPNCSEVFAWGLGAWRTGGGTAGAAPGPLQVGTITVQKARDLNTVALRNLLYTQVNGDRIELLTIQPNGPGFEDDLMVTRLRLVDSRVVAARATTGVASGDDVVELAPVRYEFGSWDPPGAIGSAPDFVYCRNLETGSEVCP